MVSPSVEWNHKKKKTAQQIRVPESQFAVCDLRHTSPSAIFRIRTPEGFPRDPNCDAAEFR